MTVLKIAHFHALRCPADMTSSLQKRRDETILIIPVYKQPEI